MFNIAVWLMIKSWCKKFWAWCKKYWQLLVGAAIPIILMLIFRKGDGASKVLNKVQEDYQKEIEAIESAHAKEIKEREKAQELYLDTIREIEEKYKEKIGLRYKVKTITLNEPKNSFNLHND